jgi:starch synthase
LKVLYIATECKPFSKAGGIGDVTGELPPALKKLGIDIEIVTPWYGSMNVAERRIPCHGHDAVSVGVIPSHLDGVPLNFVKSPDYFEGRYGSVYVDSHNVPFYDDTLRFSFFSKACLELIREKKPDIVHVNDWGLSYVFAFMELAGLVSGKVITVHNIGYQGNIARSRIPGTEMESILNSKTIEPLYHDPRPEWNSVNALRLGLELCDCAHTVSPQYAKEMLEPEDRKRYFEGGKGLETVTNRLHNEGRLVGILNGFNYRLSPTRSEFEKCLEAKAECRRHISSAFAEPDAFLVGFVGRAVEQKFKLLTEKLDGRPVMEHLLEIPGVNVCVLATGLPKYERFIKHYSRRKNYSATLAFLPGKAREICLGSDLFLMPSLYEPCGITQMEALSNATPPLVRATGGLVDTVKPHTVRNGTGFVFDGATKKQVLRNLVASVREARDMYVNVPDRYRALQERGFKQRFTWANAAKQYVSEIYEPVVGGKLRRG